MAKQVEIYQDPRYKSRGSVWATAEEYKAIRLAAVTKDLSVGGFMRKACIYAARKILEGYDIAL